MAFMSVGLAVVVVVVAYAAAVLSIVIVVCMFGERREFVDLSSDFAFDSDFHDSDVGLIANLLTYWLAFLAFLFVVVGDVRQRENIFASSRSLRSGQ